MKVRIKINKTDYSFMKGVDMPLIIDATRHGQDSYLVKIDDLVKAGAENRCCQGGTILFLNLPEFDDIDDVEEIEPEGTQEAGVIYVHTYQHASGLNQKTRVTVYTDEAKANEQCELLGGSIKKYREVEDVRIE